MRIFPEYFVYLQNKAEKMNKYGTFLFSALK